MTDVGIFRAVFVGEGVLLVIDLGDEAVIIDPFRHGRRGRPGGAGRGNGFLTAGGQLGAESKAKERAQRPVKDAMVLHKKYLQHSLDGNPMPLAVGGALFVETHCPWFSIYFWIIAEDTSPILQAKRRLCR